MQLNGKMSMRKLDWSLMSPFYQGSTQFFFCFLSLVGFEKNICDFKAQNGIA